MMLRENSIKLSLSYVIASKVKDYFQLMKFTLSFMVVFSSVVGYLMVPGVGFDIIKVLLLFIAGLCITGAANAVNQIMERSTDALMKRTAKRPLPDNRMKIPEAVIFAVVMAVAGLLIMAQVFNLLSAAVSLLSILLYGFVYTPWKKWNSLAVLIGAVPGALPPLIGWVAGAGQLTAGGWSLFAIQFLWQFPHFWAIAWVAYEDYKRAGFKLLPSGDGQSKLTAMQVIVYVLLLIVACLWPYALGLYGIVALAVITGSGGFLLYRAIALFRNCDARSARQLMFGSYIYLTVIQLVMLTDKFILSRWIIQ